MNLKLWQRCAEKYLMPELPGDWKCEGRLLYTQPVGSILRTLLLDARPRNSKSFNVSMVVQFLPVPTEHLTGPFATPIGRGRPPLPTPAGVDDAAAVMEDLLEIIKSEALPYFVRFESVIDLRNEAERLLNSGPEDPLHREIRFRASLMMGDLALAEEDAARIVALVDGGEEWTKDDWVQELRKRTVDLLKIARRSPSDAIAAIDSDAAATRSYVMR